MSEVEVQATDTTEVQDVGVLVSNDPQTIIRTARRTWSCDCHLRSHHHEGRMASGMADPWRWCENVIEVGERYPEYLGESPAYQSGSRYCADCRKDQLGDWITE